MIHEFIKKPVMVKAVQWTGDNEDELKAFTDGRVAIHNEGTVAVIKTIEGEYALATKGEWIIKQRSEQEGEHFWTTTTDYINEFYEAS